ncbi:hypothetical protein BUALT_Bualt06G0120500 [Buddleja alternifolia]|uniref:Uncharacterized protein n=1 Tax=Buddleja alternifolia TaxID=168488 RepID=A0AAV6XG54_9LAMI|nr:hypothetical protein BUALT_Bualt06G0120500 [Buddleja alternifolia]
MFSLKSGDELVFGIPSISQPDKLIPDEMIATDPDSFLQSRSKTDGRDHKNNIRRRIIHRDLEKQRRNMMSGLSTEIRGENLSYDNSVMVNLDRNGVEILIDGSDQFRLSRVLQELMLNELNVVNCVSTKAKERFFHKIQAEADDLISLDLSLLQERLIHLIN